MLLKKENCSGRSFEHQTGCYVAVIETVSRVEFDLVNIIGGERV